MLARHSHFQKLLQCDIYQESAKVSGLEFGTLILEIREEAGMLTAIVLIAIVLPALFLWHMAHEELQSQRAYRRARASSRAR
jgi:hypothetical protein